MNRLSAVTPTLAALLVAACGGASDAPVSTAGASLSVACAGAGCGASGPGTYSGLGVGVWRHVNAGGSPERVSLSIDGVRAGQGVLLLFSNGSATPTSLPDVGLGLASPRAASGQAIEAEVAAGLLSPDDARDRADAWMVDRNREEARAALATSPGGAQAAHAAAAALDPSGSDHVGPRVGDTRTWWDNWDASHVARHTAVARVVCPLPGDRHGVIWVDLDATAAGHVTEDDLRYHEATFCGTSGGYARLVALRGEPWGRDAVVSGQPGTFIQDAGPAPQDVNVVFLEVPASTPWGGYFQGLNVKRRMLGGAHATSNEALAVFLNAPAARASRGAYASTLLHELTHLVNHYQRSLVRQAPFETWLEEMSAMMTEDLIAPVVTPDGFQKIPGTRILPYVHAGGGVSLTDWSGSVGANPYPAVGTLGAFLDRRHGVAIYRGMMDCAPGLSGVGCVTALVLAAGGTGFADELARMGTSIYGLLPLAGQPGGYGFPRTVAEGYTLAAVDVAAWSTLRPAVAAPLGGSFDAASHWYQLDTVPAGQSTYARPVVVPPGVTLHVVVQ